MEYRNTDAHEEKSVRVGTDARAYASRESGGEVIKKKRDVVPS